MSNLKPCPFCGKEPNQKGTELGDRPCFYYECENPKCGASEMGWHNTEQEAIDAWNTRPIEDALHKEISQLQADNISLVEQVNQMALKPNQEVIEWHSYPEEKPEPSRCCIVERKNFCYHIAHHSEIDGWLDSVAFDVLSEVKSWAYLPIGANHE